MGKPILCLDFDGVLHSYTSAWQGAEVVADEPVPGAMDFLQRAVQCFDVCIVSSRSLDPGGRRAMSLALLDWLEVAFGADEGDRIHGQLRFPEHKPPAFLSIDDRALQFTGTFPDPASLLGFQPWNRRGV